MRDRTRTSASLGIATAAAVAAGAAFAQGLPESSKEDDAPKGGSEAASNGRYTMTPSPGGFLRLDTRTGKVSYCTTKNEVPQCRLAPDERAALEQEIDRLSKQNAELQKRVAGLPEPPRPSIPLPDKRDMDRALDFAEDFMRRMMRIMRSDPQPDRT